MPPPSCARITFCAFTSRWMMLARCTAASARHTSIPTLLASPALILPLETRAARVSPSMKSIQKPTRPLWRSAPCTRHDIVVAHASQSACLVQKVGWLNAAFRFGLEKLQRNRMIEPGVVRVKDLTVRALADLAHQEQMAPHTKVRRRRRAGWRKSPSTQSVLSSGKTRRPPAA